MGRRKAKNDLRKLFSIIKKLKIPVEKIVVFGSYARNMATEKSDLDLCIIFPKTVADVNPLMAKISFAAGKAMLNVDLTCATAEQYRTNRWSPFLHEVRTHGIEAATFLKSA